MTGGDLFPRFVLKPVLTALTDTPIVVIQGARQVGKSTLVKMLADYTDLHAVTLDDDLTLQLAHEDPKALVGSYPDGLLAIDEAQRAPELVLRLKANVDADRRPARFLLTGSADLLKVKGTGDSLAGRAETVEMMPLSQGELARREVAEDFVTWLLGGAGRLSFEALDPEVVVRGGFPEVTGRLPARAQSWFTSYAARLAGHDARELHDGGYADQLAAMLKYFAALGQTELVKIQIARHLGVAEATADGYLRLATTMRLLHQIKSWNRAPHRRLARRPKVCLLDTGLSAALTGFTAAKAATPGGREYYGALVEQFVALELGKQQAWTETRFELFHFRDLDGLEVDLVVETSGGDLIAIEVKATSSPSPPHWRSLQRFRDRYPDRNITGVLLHTGDSAATFAGWLHVLPITALWQH